MIILLDMDGVVTDAHAAFLRALDRPDLIANQTPGVFGVNELVGVSEEEMWRVVDEAGEDVIAYDSSIVNVERTVP